MQAVCNDKHINAEQTSRQAERSACSLLVELQKALQSQNRTSRPEAQTNVVTASEDSGHQDNGLKNSQVSDVFVGVSSLLLGVSKLEDEQNKCTHVQTYLQCMDPNLSCSPQEVNAMFYRTGVIRVGDHRYQTRGCIHTKT